MYNLQGLLNGSQFSRLLEGKDRILQEKYGIKEKDLRVIRHIKQSEDGSLIYDLARAGFYDKEELKESINRLRDNGVINVTTNHSGAEGEEIELTAVGRKIWKQINEDYNYAIEVVFRGMTEEQVKTYKRLSQIIIDNIDKEMKKI